MKTLQEIEIIDPASIAGLDGEAQRKAMWARALDLTPAQHKAAYRGLKMLQRYAEAIEDTFKQRVEAGEIPGYGLKEKSGRRKITNVATAYERAAAHGVTPEAFTAKCSISMKGLNEALKNATKAKGKALEQMAAQVLDGITETGKPVFEVVEVAALE